MIKETGCNQKESIDLIVKTVGVIPEFSQMMDYRFDRVDEALEEFTKLFENKARKIAPVFFSTQSSQSNPT